jgi:tetratricopeptide (TPR) repeat protein
VDDSTEHTKKSEGNNHIPGEESSSSNGDALITPLKVPIQGEKTARSTIPRSDSAKRVYVIAGLLIMIVGGLWLFSYLSRNPVRTVSLPREKPPPKQPAQELPSTIPLTPTDGENNTEHSAQDKIAAEQKLADFLQAKKTLDGKGVAEWGGEVYEEAVQLAKTADEAFIKREFTAASRHYGEALVLLNELLNGIDATVERFLDQAQRALKEGDGKRAEQLFSVVLMIDPGNDSARHNLERAKNTEAVMQLIASGASHEENNDLSRALTDYQEAVRLDPESEKAQTALRRVKNLIAAEQFQQLMSAGFTALNERDYTGARSSFLKARSFQPDSHEVKDALLQVDTAIRLARIEALREKALASESSEKWHEALSSYQEVLTIDSSIQFALHGKERSLKRKQLDESMQRYLEKPSVLESDHSLEKAITLLGEARQIEPHGPRLTQQLNQLDRLVTEAQIPVPVTIESDSLTEVAIYKVGKLGRFSIRELTLRPGTYTIVGARKGFKDVRQKIAVKAGKGPIEITLKCSEKI